MNKNNYLRPSSVRRALVLTGTGLPLLAWAGVSRAQAPEKIRRIGILSMHAPSNPSGALRRGLRELGWIEGKNMVIENRYAQSKVEHLPELAAELVRLKVDVIVALVPPAASAAQRATTSIPVVMTFSGDPVANGQVKSLARPGGNVTGLSQMAVELLGKRLELLKEMVPRLHRVAVLWDPSTYGYKSLTWKELELSARQLSVQLLSLEVRDASEFERVFEEAARARAGALFVIPAPLTEANLQSIALLAAKHRLPSTYHFSRFADVGGLVSYGPNLADFGWRAAVFVDKILKGAKPGELPIEQPTKIDLVINLRTAKALGITIPQSILVRADRVIE